MQLVWDFCRARRRGGLDDGGQAVEFVLLVVVRVYGPVTGSRLAAEMSRCGVDAGTTKTGDEQAAEAATTASA